MTNILVPTDFSQAADHALGYAEVIAENFSATISLVYIHPRLVAEATENEVDDSIYAEAEARIQALANNIRASGIAINAMTYRGNVISTLKKIIDDGDCQLIIMGCQGEHYLPNNPWGSTTTALLMDTRIPIIAVPSFATIKYPRRYLLATDRDCPSTLRQLRPLLTLLPSEGSELLLFHYLQATERDLPDQAYSKLLADIPHTFYYQVDNRQTIGNVIIDFADKVSADLLVVRHREDGWINQPAPNSTARRMIWTSSVPVLVLQEGY